MDRLNVATSRVQPVAAVLAGVMMVPLALGSIASGVARGFAPMPVALGLALLAMFGLVMGLVRRGRRNSVRYFSDQGLERGDGRFLPWADLERVVYQVRTRPEGTSLWRTEIRFRSGESAWLLPLRVANFREVSEFVHRLPCEHTEVSV